MHADSSSTPSNNIDPTFADTSSGGDTADMQKTSAVAEQKQIRMDDDTTSGVLDYILCADSKTRKMNPHTQLFLFL